MAENQQDHERNGKFAQGNKAASHERPWSDALKRTLLAEDGKRLRMLAERLVTKAIEGDVAACREIGDRLEGKPKQQLEHTGVDGEPIATSVEVKFRGGE